MPKSVSRPSQPKLADRLAGTFQRFVAIEAASAILLLLATALALVWANSPWQASYERFWNTPIGVRFGDGSFTLSLLHAVNDGLMALFFFVVGMEIKHEVVRGQLSTRERAMLPVFGAAGGMLVPALLYLLFHAKGPAAPGWGIPMATDIAFAVAALAVLGSRVPSGLRVFLLALAIVDDLGAVTVIAAFYTNGLSLPALAAAALGLVIVWSMQRAGVRSYPLYWIAGVACWAATLASGVHATVAGVALGLLTPANSLGSEDGLAAPPPLEVLTSKLHGFVAFIVMPVFALANAGVRIDASALADPLAVHVTLAVGLGLLVGKPLGITLFAHLAVRLRIAVLPSGVGWGAIAGAGVLAGIGFTMALFITVLAFDDARLASASKIGILAASVAATLGGLALLARTLPRAAPPPE
ncbi:MAG: Na+/H+ antiporter NhaA [Deltaproteobacteria bacterium]|nr:Na+/H+ antiporter NhaA [Deltaproteobacteria bacterium]